jgi:hypothetical protein
MEMANEEEWKDGVQQWKKSIYKKKAKAADINIY